MEIADGFHSGDHSGSKHWKDKKIPHQGCGNCGPVFVEIINNSLIKIEFKGSHWVLLFVSTQMKVDVINEKEECCWTESSLTTEIN